MLEYVQSTGVLRENEEIWGVGYSGAPGSVNDSTKEHVKNHGPIPRGVYQMLPPVQSKKVGPMAIPLRPVEHNARGRSAFMIHGDNSKGNQSASEGCIIMYRVVRRRLFNERIGKKGDLDLLKVV
jgi:hypothetical protein